MTTTIIISLCSLLLLAYLFDISSGTIKIPSVILLLALGYVVKQLTSFLAIPVPDLTKILPVLGTVGLILIVLEGALELEFNRTKLPLIGKASLVALLPMIAFSIMAAYAVSKYAQVNMKVALANVIPLSVISSAIAIPSARNLVGLRKEFITYESSLSDIFGVLFFNFITLNDNISSGSVTHFLLQLLLILIISFVATIILAFLLSHIRHHIKFVPIMLMTLLIYSIAKLYHLPGLIFILLFGLFLGNLDELKGNTYIQKLRPAILNREVHKFKEITVEIAFLIRALFFLLFGYLIDTSELFDPTSIVWAAGLTAAIFLLRWIILRLFKLEIKPLLFIAPRGLITILLFLSIPAAQSIPLAGKSLVIQVIILSALIMMFGLMIDKKEKQV